MINVTDANLGDIPLPIKFVKHIFCLLLFFAYSYLLMQKRKPTPEYIIQMKLPYIISGLDIASTVKKQKAL